jgi:hypothetical protein
MEKKHPSAISMRLNSFIRKVIRMVSGNSKGDTQHTKQKRSKAR